MSAQCESPGEDRPHCSSSSSRTDHFYLRGVSCVLLVMRRRDTDEIHIAIIFTDTEISIRVTVFMDIYIYIQNYDVIFLFSSVPNKPGYRI